MASAATIPPMTRTARRVSTAATAAAGARLESAPPLSPFSLLGSMTLLVLLDTGLSLSVDPPMHTYIININTNNMHVL